MQFYRCKCGKTRSWSSMSPDSCRACPDCGSDLARAPDLHREPRPHEWIEERVETDDGKGILTVCRYCHEPRKVLEGPPPWPA